MTRARLADVGLVVLAAFITIVNSGFSKPLWIDEYVNFAVGALTFDEAVRAIAASTGDGVNWGQTGLDQFLGYTTGTLFGANIWLFRLPYAIAGLLMFISAVWFIRNRGLPRIWQLLVMLALWGQATLVYYIGEARPYILLGSAVVAMLAFYGTKLSDRSQPLPMAIGIYGLVIGSAVHPYWLLFFCFVATYGLCLSWYSGQIGGRGDALRFLCPPLVVTGLVLYSLLAALTWLNRPSRPVKDAWEIVGSPANWARTMLSTHLEFIIPTFPYQISRFLAVTVILIITTLAIASKAWRSVIVMPVSLLWLAVLSSLVLSLVSLEGRYWIVPRQWLAGLSLTAIAFVWFLGQMWSSRHRISSKLVLPIAALSIVLLVGQMSSALSDSLTRIGNHESTFSDFRTVSGSNFEVYERYVESGDVVPAGNVNAVRGGSVWREHARYYGRE